MKIDAYNEQKRIAEMLEKPEVKAADGKELRAGGIFGKSLTDAVVFDRSKGNGNLFSGTGYGLDDDLKSSASGNGVGNGIQEIADEAALFRDNFKAICNKMDMGDLVSMDEEGVDINDTEVENIVTVGEQIRIKLAASGNERVYTQDIDASDIEAVYGSMAYVIADKLAQYNYPVTEDNVGEIASALTQAESLSEPDLSAMAYLMNNGLEPTLSNLYKAEHAVGYVFLEGGNVGENDGRALTERAEGVIDDVEWQKLVPQIEGMLSECSLVSDENTLSDIRNLVENGVAITPESLKIYKQVSEAKEIIAGIHSDNKETAGEYRDILADKMAAALVDLDRVRDVNLSDEPACWQKAADAIQVLDNVTEEALTEFADGTERGTYASTLMGLKQAEEHVIGETVAASQKGNPLDTYSVYGTNAFDRNFYDKKSSFDEGENLRAVRLLYEVRLMMTFESAYVLEKNGIDVNTTELSKLVEELRRVETAVFGADRKAAEDDGGAAYDVVKAATRDGAGAQDAVQATFRNSLAETMQAVSGLKTAPCDAIGQVCDRQHVTFKDMQETAYSMQREYEAAGRAYETMATEVRPDLGDRIDKAVAASADNVLKELEFDINEENRRAVRILAYNKMEITTERLNRVKEIDAAVNNLFKKMTPDIALDMLRDGTDIMGADIDELSAEVDKRKEEKEIIVTQSFGEYLYNLEKHGEISQDDREKYMALYTIVNKLIKDKGKASGQLVNQGKEATIGNLVTAYMTVNDAGMNVGISDNDAGNGERRQHNNAKLTYYKELLSQLSDVPKEAAEFVTENELPHTVSNMAAAGALYADDAYVYKDMKKTGIEASLERFLDAMDDKDSLIDTYKELGEQLAKVMETATEQADMPDIQMLRNISNGIVLLGAMSRHNTFYIPYDKETGTSAIKLSVIENSDKAGSFTVDMDTQEYGHIQVSAKVDGDELTAYILYAGTNDGGKDIPLQAFDNLCGEIKAALGEKGFSSVKIGSSSSRDFPPLKSGKVGKTEVKKLFAAAKVFVQNFR